MKKMPSIETFVFFDIETTGLPWQERNQTKIIELSFVAVSRKQLLITLYGQLPPVSKLTFVLNPQKTINPRVVNMTGLCNELLQHAPVFSQKTKSLITFLEELSKPVCLVAHNGNIFDFKILLAECNDAGVCLPEDLLCLDSLVGFRALLKNSNITYKDLEKVKYKTSVSRNSLDTSIEDILTDDEDIEWDDIDLTNEELDEIDDICISLSGESVDDVPTSSTEISKERSKVIAGVFGKKMEKTDFKLTSLYRRLLNKNEDNAHRAEVDCLMLAECVVAMKEDFLPWADKSCKLLSEIKPLIRY